MTEQQVAIVRTALSVLHHEAMNTIIPEEEDDSGIQRRTHQYRQSLDRACDDLGEILSYSWAGRIDV